MTQAETSQGRIMAAIDLGSNSFHLGIARVLDGSIQPMHRMKQRVQLAEDADDLGNLHPDAMERGLESLRQFSQRLNEMRFDEIRIVATYALRQAPNRRDFIRRAREILDYPIEVIPGREEARLIYVGVSQNQSLPFPTLVIDIGGGSTELIIGQGHQPRQMESLNMGCVSYQSRYFGDGKLSAKRMRKAILAAEQQLEKLQQRYLRQGFHSAVGCSGTIKAIASIVNDGDLLQPLTLKQLEKLARSMVEHEHVDQLPFDHLADLRRKVLPSGLAILIACFRQLEIEQLEFSEHALREGVLSEMADEAQHQDVQKRTIASLQKRYQLDKLHSQRIFDSASQLYRQAELGPKRHLCWLRFAAALHEIGLHINYRGIHKHGEYILTNSNLPGFTVEEQQLLAFLVRWHRKKLTGCEPPRLQLMDKDAIAALLLSLRLSVLMHLGRRHHIALPGAELRKRTLTLSFGDNLDEDDLLVADLEMERQHLEELDWRLEWG